MQNRTTTLEVAIIGSGFGFHEVLPAILTISNVRVFLMKPRDYSSITYKKYDLPNVTFLSIDEIISRESISMVFIAVPPFLQQEFVAKIAPSGKAIYLEKPAGLNYSDALNIQRITQEFHNNLYVGFHFRFDPVLLFLKSYLDAHLGPNIERTNVNWQIKKSAPKEDWKQNLALGGGVYRDHLCHIIDLLRSIFGFPEDSFRPNIETNVGGMNLLDYVRLSSNNLQIEINRGTNLNSSLKIEFLARDENVTVKTFFPFRLRDYSVTQNGLVIELPKDINLNQDARRYALNSYFQLILNEEYPNHIETQRTGFPRIEDAMFTQKISDRINAVS
jgi:hypothetical protein